MSLDVSMRNAVIYIMCTEASEPEEMFIDTYGYTIKKHINDSYAPWHVLTKTASIGWLKVVKLLIEHGADINTVDSSGDTALSEAVSHCNIEIIDYLFKHNVDISINNYRAIIRIKVSLPSKRINLIKCFIRNNVQVDTLLQYLEQDDLSRKFLNTERLIQITLIFHDLPQYIILWITDWLPGSNSLTEYQKIKTIEGVQKNVKNELYV